MSGGDESINLSWTPRAAELADAQLARSRELGVTSIRSGVAVAMAVFGALMLTSRDTISLAIVLFAMAFVLAGFRVTATILRRRWAAIIAGNPALAEPVEATLDASGIRTDGDRMSIARRWSAFTSWSDAPNAVVFATGDNAYGAILVVPHRAMSGPEELAAVRNLAEQQLGPALGSGPSRWRRRWWPWVARGLVLALLVVPLAITLTDVHDETGEWRLWPAEAPLLLSYDGHDFRRVGGPTSQPDQAVGVGYTPGGGLILKKYRYFGPEEVTELWVLDHDSVVHHYVTEVPSPGLRRS